MKIPCRNRLCIWTGPSRRCPVVNLADSQWWRSQVRRLFFQPMTCILSTQHQAVPVGKKSETQTVSNRGKNLPSMKDSRKSWLVCFPQGLVGKVGQDSDAWIPWWKHQPYSPSYPSSILWRGSTRGGSPEPGLESHGKRSQLPAGPCYLSVKVGEPHGTRPREPLMSSRITSLSLRQRLPCHLPSPPPRGSGASPASPSALSSVPLPPAALLPPLQTSPSARSHL